MPSPTKPIPQQDAVDILLIGTVTRDLLGRAPEEYRLGGTVSFAAAAAIGLDRQPVIVARAATPDHLEELPPSASIHLLHSPTTSTFANIYTDEGRVQYCYTPTAPIHASDIPQKLRAPSAVLLGPLVRDVEPDVAAIFPEDTLVVAVPQGWMRVWDETGRVSHERWRNAHKILPNVDVLVLSLEDIDDDISRLDPWFEHVPLIIVTEYRDGSTIYQRQDDGQITVISVPPRPALRPRIGALSADLIVSVAESRSQLAMCPAFSILTPVPENLSPVPRAWAVAVNGVLGEQMDCF